MKYIDRSNPIEELQTYLEALEFIKNERIIRVETPGVGNMNVVLRVISNKRSFILKQSRPFVQKYQSIPAPVERIDTEYQFYYALLSAGLDIGVPKIISYSESEHLLMMEDLGDCEDMSSVYSERAIQPHALQQLLDIASSIHSTKVAETYPLNRELRELNHEHVFVLPFMKDNGFELDEVQKGLQELSQEYKDDEYLKMEVAAMGSLYLSQGDSLIHGDFYPGSWMHSDDQIFVIDPEFSFLGFKEFDLGVLAGHMVISSMDVEVIDKIIKSYKFPIEKKILKKITGIEILRRLIGLAQLPLTRSIEEKKELLIQAKALVLS